jgi:hypothetical protein
MDILKILQALFDRFIGESVKQKLTSAIKAKIKVILMFWM